MLPLISNFEKLEKIISKMSVNPKRSKLFKPSILRQK
jgi:hypothetical protein